MQPSHGPRKLFRRRRSHLALILLAVVVVVAAVATGAVWWLSRSGGPATGTVPSPSTPAGPTASASPSVAGTPRIKGVVVQVLNGTTRKRFAATTSQVLAKAGYTTTSPANSESRRNVTLIAYQPRFGADAAFIQRVYFPHATLQEAFVPFASGADITVLLGKDALG
jgi:hypothetical protein